jgi:hypothetical protein
MIMAIGSLLGKKKHPRHAAAYTALFAAGIFVAYALLGTLITIGLKLMPIGVVGYFGLAVAVALVIFGIFEVKDYFWAARFGASMSKSIWYLVFGIWQIAAGLDTRYQIPYTQNGVKK